MTHSLYHIENTSTIYSPGLVFFLDLIRQNLARTIELAGSVDRLRPHCKTHKTREIVQLELAAGIRKHKVATLAEAELLASCGVPDVFIAYPIVGPNQRRLAELIRRYPNTRFSVTVDHPHSLKTLSQTMSLENVEVDALLDLDVGQHRTGISPGPEAESLYEQMLAAPGLKAVGFHVYDGHNHQPTLAERQAAVQVLMEPVLRLRETLEAKGVAIRRLIMGGTPTFPVFARMDIPGLECSPGTLILHDHSYSSKFPDLSPFVPAALLLTRVISRPTKTRVTFDLGYKAVASDPPAGKRLVLLDVPEYEAILQNEEHLVVETPAAESFQPGDERLAIPTHICPTVAMHQQAYVVEGGKVIGTWPIVGRDRVLTI